jgi:predicted lactoylglutathione lyase
VREEFALEARQTPSGRAVIISLPANIFSGGDYFITLASEAGGKTSDIAAEYQFKVVKP